MAQALTRALRHPLYLPPPARPAIHTDLPASITLAVLAYALLLASSYVALSPTPYTRANRLLRLLLLPPTLVLLSQIYLGHKAGDLEPWNESGWGALGVIVGARACILAFGLFGRAGRLRWIGWGWYTRREEGWWTTPAGQDELKRFHAEVLRDAVPAAEEAAYPAWSPPRRILLAALFLASPRHLGFSTARPPSFYRHPARPVRYHLSLLLACSTLCDAVILLYARHAAFCTFELDPALRPRLADPLPPPYPSFLPAPLRAATHTLAVGLVIQSAMHLSHSSAALLSYALLPRDLAARLPFPSLTLLAPFRLEAPSVRAFWSQAWHDVLSLDIAHVAYFPILAALPPGAAAQALAVLSAFAFSGLLHGVSLDAVGIGSDYKRMLGLFVLQGAAIVLEQAWERMTGRKVGGRVGKVWTVACVGASAAMLAELYVSRGFLGFRRPFSPLGHLLRHLGYWPPVISTL
ncbi:hypothetical protein JCM10207_001267 [Rhodosporidiobolus poonsookiae]